MKRGWPFVVAAALPCVALLLLCGVGLHEWWLISTKQIAVIPAPHAGDTAAAEVPAANVMLLAFGAGALAAAFAYALWRGSRGALLGGYLGILVVVGLVALRRML